MNELPGGRGAGEMINTKGDEQGAAAGSASFGFIQRNAEWQMAKFRQLIYLLFRS